MKNLFKIKAIIITVLFALNIFILNSASALNKVQIHFFYSQSCPHCKQEKVFLDDKVKTNSNYIVNEYKINGDKENVNKYIWATKRLNIQSSGVPLTIIGDKYVLGYLNDESSGNKILSLLSECENLTCNDIFTEYSQQSIDPTIDFTNNVSKQSIENKNNNLPTVFGINLNTLSLPALTIVLGFLDGFNPCAMWVLLFLISLLIGMENKKRMWSLGIAFILASSFVYFLFMVAWLKLFQFIGLVIWVRIAIALIALIGGSYSFKKGMINDTGCEVGDTEKKKKIFDKLAKITTQNSFILSLIGIIGLAFAVNLIELVCSSGFPAVYTQVLSLNNLTQTQYYLYILGYILFFMIDDLFVFIVAMLTLQLTGITTKYVKYTRIIGGILMVIIGLLLIFKPQFLMFG